MTMYSAIAIAVLLFFSVVRGDVGKCITYNFDSGLQNFDNEDTLCQHLPTWAVGKYSDINVEHPDESDSFIYAVPNLSCASTFKFAASPGVVETDVYIASNDTNDRITAFLMMKSDNHGFDVTVTSTTVFDVNGWNTLKMNIPAHYKEFVGYVVFIGTPTQESTLLLIDSFRFIPSSVTANDCIAAHNAVKLTVASEVVAENDEDVAVDGEDEGADGEVVENNPDTENVEEEDAETNPDNETEGGEDAETNPDNETEGGEDAESNPDTENVEEEDEESIEDNVTEGGEEAETNPDNENGGEDGESIPDTENGEEEEDAESNPDNETEGEEDAKSNEDNVTEEGEEAETNPDNETEGEDEEVENSTESITEVTTEQPVTEEVTEITTEQPVTDAVTEITTEQPVTEAVTDITTEQPVTEAVTDITTEQPVTEAVTDITTEQPVTEAVTDITTEQPVTEAVTDITTEQPVTEAVTDITTEQPVTEAVTDITTEQPVTEAVTDITTEQPVTEAVTDITTEQPVTEAVTEVAEQPVTEKLDQCVTYNFEENFDVQFTHNNDFCNGFLTWQLGNYATEDLVSPNTDSQLFISPSEGSSCVASNIFYMSPNGIIEANVYMRPVNNTDHIIVLVQRLREDNADAVVGFHMYYPENRLFVDGWNTLQFDVNDFESFYGYIILFGSENEGSTVLVDSVRYIPPSSSPTDEECLIY